MYIASQIFEIIALLIDLIAYHFKTKKKIFIASNIAILFDMIHYLLLGAYSAVFTKPVTLIRNDIIVRKEKNKKLDNKMIVFAFILVYLVIGFFSYKNIYSLIPIFISIIYLLVVWNGRELQVKRISFICSVLWVIYNICIMSYAGIFSKTILMISILIAYLNERKRHKKH